jgi:hypothetical protein
MEKIFECLISYLRNSLKRSEQICCVLSILPNLAATSKTMYSFVQKEFVYFESCLRESVRFILHSKNFDDLQFIASSFSDRKPVERYFPKMEPTLDYLSKELEFFEYDAFCAAGLVTLPEKSCKYCSEQDRTHDEDNDEDDENEIFMSDVCTEIARIFACANKNQAQAKAIAIVWAYHRWMCKSPNIIHWPTIFYEACRNGLEHCVSVLLKCVPLNLFKFDSLDIQGCLPHRKCRTWELHPTFSAICVHTAIRKNNLRLCDILFRGGDPWKCNFQHYFQAEFERAPHFEGMSMRWDGIDDSTFLWLAEKNTFIFDGGQWNKKIKTFIRLMFTKKLNRVRKFFLDSAHLPRDYWTEICHCDDQWGVVYTPQPNHGQLPTQPPIRHPRWWHCSDDFNSENFRRSTISIQFLRATALLVDDYGIEEVISHDNYKFVRELIARGYVDEAQQYLARSTGATLTKATVKREREVDEEKRGDENPDPPVPWSKRMKL